MTALEHLIHHFFPHKHNNHRARALHPQILFSYLLFFVLFQFAAPFLIKTKGSVLGFATNIAEDRLFELTNQRRLEAGVAPLRFNQKLAAAAQAKAAYMFTQNFWAHNGPDGTTPWKFVTDVNYDYMYAGENLAKDFENSSDVVEAWMASPTHRDNILQPRYEDIGFAVVNGTLLGEDTTLIVQMFGKEIAPVANAPEVRAARVVVPVVQNQNLNSAISKFIFTKEFSIAFIGFLILMLTLDGFLIWKNNIYRVAGHNFVHIIFLGSLLIALFFMKTGSVL